MSPSIQNDLRRNAPSKTCTVSGCGGMMTLRGNNDAVGGAAGPSSGGTWVCDTNPAHVEAAGSGDA
jgi:hypothetical protein